MKDFKIIKNSSVTCSIERWNVENWLNAAFQTELELGTGLEGINSFSLLIRDVPFFISPWCKIYSRVENGQVVFAMKKTFLGKIFFRKGQLEKWFSNALEKAETELSI